ncbi:MAG: dihydropteroate synthase [Candidatus Neomarinimicrobiota bacterium]|jgi:dihydropteroate synthase
MFPKIMGILNLTPDSFSDGGMFFSKSEALFHAEAMVKDGADIIDIGGESTRPGSSLVPLQEELDRVMPVLEEVVNWDVEVSVDTNKAEVARLSLELGVDIINDISALTFDESLVDHVVKHEAKLVLMHMRGIPRTMQKDLKKVDIIPEVLQFLKSKSDFALSKGVKQKNIILDPGIGFGKDLEDNINIIKHIAVLKELGYPLLIGASRKSMISMIAEADIDDRLSGSLAIACVSAQRGVDILRVHDVAETIQALKVIEKIW